MSSRYVLEIEADDEVPWSVGFLGSVPDFTAVYRWNQALGLTLARTKKDRTVVHENASTSHAEYSCWDADRGCRWTVLINVPETGSGASRPGKPKHPADGLSNRGETRTFAPDPFAKARPRIGFIPSP